MSENENSKNLDQSQLAARLAQVQPLRDLASSWYALSVACRCVGAMIERAAKEILYEGTDNSMGEGETNGNE